jgi:hypothetical membrane protein
MSASPAAPAVSPGSAARPPAHDHAGQRVSRSLVRLGGACWALLVGYFLIQAAAQLAFQPAYSLLDDRVSDLGNTTCGPWLAHSFACSPLHPLVNAGFVLTGVLFVLGAILTWPAWPARRLSAAGLLCVIAAGLGYVLVGLAPENVNLRLHLLGATNLVTSNLGLLLLGLSTRREATWWPRLGLVLTAIAALGIVSGPLLLVSTHRGGGLAERLVLYPCVIFLLAVGASLVLRGRAAHIWTAGT